MRKVVMGLMAAIAVLAAASIQPAAALPGAKMNPAIGASTAAPTEVRYRHRGVRRGSFRRFSGFHHRRFHRRGFHHRRFGHGYGFGPRFSSHSYGGRGRGPFSADGRSVLFNSR